MNYIWETMLKSDQCGLPREKLHFVPAKVGSPYMEVIQENMNNDTMDGSLVEINPLYRFSSVFSSIFDHNLEDYSQTRTIFFNVGMHYIANLDLRQGLDAQEYEIFFLLNDILYSVYGNDAREAIRSFEKGKLRQLLRLILKLYQCGSSIYLFKEVMRYLYPDSLVYASNDEVRQLLVYIGKEDTDVERRKMEFLQNMFLPINYQIFLFWEHHFGIIGVDETMKLDEMVLF